MFFDEQKDLKVKRKVFFSFEYIKDGWRAGQVRNMGVVDDSSTFSDNDWEQVRKNTDLTIARWINSELQQRSCIVVLIGETTFTRKWVLYEIKKAYEMNKGILGIRINQLKDRDGKQSKKGGNPFSYVYTERGEELSQYVELYDSPYSTSRGTYDYIKRNISNWIEYALENKAP